MLISQKSNESSTTLAYLKVLVDPILLQIKNIMDKQLYRQDPPVDDDESSPPLVRMHLNHLIMAIGSISKGFPEYIDSSSNQNWTPVFRDALTCVLNVLHDLSSSLLIRDAVCLTLIINLTSKRR